MRDKLEFALKKLIKLVEAERKRKRGCCGSRSRLKKAFYNVENELEIEKKKPSTVESIEDLAKIESLLKELAKEMRITLRRR